MEQIKIPTVKLGTQGLEVSKLGFGCMNLSGAYDSAVPDEDGIAILKHAFNNGITFFDTSDVYGPHSNEILIGKAMKQLPREKIQIATKFGIVPQSGSMAVNGITFFDTSDIYGPHSNEILIGKAMKQLPRENVQIPTKFGIVPQSGSMAVNGKPEYVRSCCLASLERLGLDYIDLYYQHRIDQTTPIEETVMELKKLVEEGKVKYIGLSEASPDTIRRAHAVHPVTAVQMEWSLWSRDIEEDIVPLCRELGIGIVPYSPLGRGFFGGRSAVEATSILSIHPRFIGENVEKNKVQYAKVEKLASKHNCTPAQLALAWVLHQGEDVIPIPGTTKIKNMNANISSLNVKLTDIDLKEISDAISFEEVSGSRNFTFAESYGFKHANTPAFGGN